MSKKNTADEQYAALLREVLSVGSDKPDRTGTGTLSVFGRQMRFDMRNGFPLLTTKRVWFKGVAAEMAWMVSGSTSIMPLLKQGVGIWTAWPHARYVRQTGLDLTVKEFESGLLDGSIGEEHAELGPVYGAQWRGRSGRDQLAEAVRLLREDPYSRRIVVDAWNVADLSDMLLPPCHTFFQFCAEPQASGTNLLNLSVYFRSNDLFLGTPFDIASFALLLHATAKTVGMEPGVLTYTVGDAHVYKNHLDQVEEQLSRSPFPLPTLKVSEGFRGVLDMKTEDFEVVGYRHHAPIRGDIAV